jgi:hypothetical protein
MDPRWFFAGVGKYPDLCAFACALADASNGYLKRTFGAGDQKKWTYSVWLDMYDEAYNENIFTTYLAGAQTSLQINSVTGGLQFYSNWTGGGFHLNPSAGIGSGFKHLGVIMDTAQATAADRLRLYIDNVKITSFSTETYPAQNATPGISSANDHWIGGVADTSYSDSIHAADCFVGGYAPADMSDFGQVSPLDGSWVYKEPTGLTWGTNGLYLDYADSGALGNDVSGNNNDFTPTNCTQTTTTPTSA